LCSISKGKRSVVPTGAYFYNTTTFELFIDSGYIYEQKTEYFEIYIKTYIKTNFPSGYVCVLNKQPTGPNNKNNSVKLDISNYLIAPINNGGFYNMY
jgi:hypothetical protein